MGNTKKGIKYQPDSSVAPIVGSFCSHEFFSMQPLGMRCWGCGGGKWRSLFYPRAELEKGFFYARPVTCWNPTLSAARNISFLRCVLCGSTAVKNPILLCAWIVVIKIFALACQIFPFSGCGTDTIVNFFGCKLNCLLWGCTFSFKLL
jgi:hypothetical protein